MDIMQQIIKIDKQAAERAAQAIEKEQRLSDESGEQAKRENSEMISKEREKMQSICKSQEQTLNEKLRQAEKIRDERCEALDKVFGEKRGQWKSEIIGCITGV